MTRAATSLSSPGAELSATRLRLRAVGLEVARQCLATLMQRDAHVSPLRRPRPSGRDALLRRAAPIWRALGLALAGFGTYPGDAAPEAHNLPPTLRRVQT